MGDKSDGLARWIKPASKSNAPAVLLTLVCEPLQDAPKIGTGTWGLTLFRVHCALVRKTRGKYGEPLYRRFSEVTEFWDWLETEFTSWRKIHVYTPQVVHSLLLLNWFGRLEEHGCKLEPSKDRPRGRRVEVKNDFQRKVEVIASLPDGATPADRKYSVHAFIDGNTAAIVKYTVNQRRFQWHNFGQYFSASEEQLAAALNFNWFVTPALDGSRREERRAPSERVMLWCRAFVRLYKWWIKNDGGPWGPSTASLAMSFLRRRIPPKSILHHDHAAAGELEEAAIFGGRRSVWFVGNVGTADDWKQHGAGAPSRAPYDSLPAGMVHHDVRSLYPFLLASNLFPVQLLTVKVRPSLDALHDALRTFGVIAKVKLQAHEPEYPQRTKAGIRYPVGHFWTTLPGPELARALLAGEVAEVASAAYYRLADPFARSCSALLAMREHYRDEEEPAWELFAKNLGNSLAGKIAQRQWSWAPRPKVVPPDPWGYFYRSQPAKELKQTFRAMCGMAWERVEADTKSRPMGAAFAYLTSYGRCLLRDWRAKCPHRSVLAMDTDGFWTTRAALPAIYGSGPTDSKTSGAFNVTSEVPCGRFFGPQHYWTTKRWVLAGQCQPHATGRNGIAEVREAHADIWNCKTVPPAILMETRSERNIERTEALGTILDSGWIQPTYIPLDGEPHVHQRKPDPNPWKDGR